MVFSKARLLEYVIQPLGTVRSAALFSAAALGFALFSQFVQGYSPCELCVWQRWPFALIIGAGLLSFVWPRPLALLAFTAVTFLTNAGIAFFHAGVEQKWWQGLSGCTSKLDLTLPLDQMIAQLEAAPLATCDTISWSFLGLSMATWNFAACAVLGTYCLAIALCALKGDGKKCEAA